MDLDRLKSLIDMLKELDVAEFRYKDADMSVAVRLGGHAALPPPVVQALFAHCGDHVIAWYRAEFSRAFGVPLPPISARGRS